VQFLAHNLYTGWLKIKYPTGEYAIISATIGLILKILEAA